MKEMKSFSVSKFIISFLLFLLMVECENIPRDNLLDPQNPESYSSSVVLLEAFVNTNNPLPFNKWSLQALDQVKTIYGQNILITQYHRDTDQYWDPFTIPLKTEALYEKYVNNSVPNLKGVPDIFVNGTTNRVQGASSVNSVATRLNDILSSEVIKNNFFTLEAVETTINNSQLKVSCKIARLGTQFSENLILRLILVREINNQQLKRVVIDFTKSDTIQRIDAGEIKTIAFDPLTLTEIPQKLIFSLTSADELTVYQNLEVSL